VIVLYLEYANGIDPLKIDSAVVLAWNWVFRRFEDQPERVLQIDGEGTFPISDELVSAFRFVHRYGCKIRCSPKYRKAPHDHRRLVPILFLQESGIVTYLLKFRSGKLNLHAYSKYKTIYLSGKVFSILLSGSRR
jgi:hypothetical protein